MSAFTGAVHGEGAIAEAAVWRIHADFEHVHLILAHLRTDINQLDK